MAQVPSYGSFFHASCEVRQKLAPEGATWKARKIGHLHVLPPQKLKFLLVLRKWLSALPACCK
jgi:hypothetical protein